MYKYTVMWESAVGIGNPLSLWESAVVIGNPLSLWESAVVFGNPLSVWESALATQSALFGSSPSNHNSMKESVQYFHFQWLFVESLSINLNLSFIIEQNANDI